MTRKIAVGFGGSDGARKALQEATRLARLEKAELWVVSIEELPRYPGVPSEVNEEREAANHYLHTIHQEAAALANREGVTLHTDIRIGHPARRLWTTSPIEGSICWCWATVVTPVSGEPFSAPPPIRWCVMRPVRCWWCDEYSEKTYHSSCRRH